jgi:hypothetical protein
MKYLLILHLLIIQNLSFAGRPLKSNDASTLGRHYFQIELASDIINLNNQQYAVFPVALTYGLGDNTDLFLGSLLFSNSSSNGYISFECFDLGIKQNLITSDVYNFAFASGLSSAVIESNLSSPSAFFSLINSFSFNDLTLHFNLGYNQNFGEEEFRDIWFTSFGAEFAVSDKLTLAADMGIGRDPSVNCSTVQSYSLIGFSYSLFDNLSLDTGLSFSFQHITKIEMLTTGFTLIL